MGLAMTTHLTSILVFPLVLLSLGAKSYTKFTVGLGLGLVPFILLPFFAAGSSPVLWGDPSSLRGWLWLVSAKLYHPNILLEGAVIIGIVILLAVTKKS